MPPTLYTFAISHFSEKARWTLDAAGIDYREAPLVPFFHLWQTRRIVGHINTVPILIEDQTVLRSSDAILAWAQARTPSENAALFPLDAAEQAQFDTLQQRYMRIGRYVIRCAYDGVLRQPDALVAVWSIGASAAQKWTLRTAAPLLKQVLRRRFRIDPASVEAATRTLQAELDTIDAALAGGEYLIGQRFTVADIMVAALLAPLADPEGHPVYTRPEFRRCAADATALFATHPTIAWVKRRYAENRGSVDTLVRTLAR